MAEMGLESTKQKYFAQEPKITKFLYLLTFYILQITVLISDMFERFRKKKDESKQISPEKDGDTVDLSSKNLQYEPVEMKPDESHEVIAESKPRPFEQVKIPEPVQQTSMSTPTEDIGI